LGSNDDDKTLRGTVNKLDLDRVPELVGEGPMERLERLCALTEHQTKPLYYVGPAGSSKSITAMNVLKWYARKHKVPAYIVQVSPEMTKSTLVMGKQLRNGDLVTVKGCLAIAAEEGAIVFIDESQQGTQEILATMQSLFERNSNITDTSYIVYPKDTFRVIFASNSSQSHAANVPLPHAFAARLITELFDYPSFKDEVIITKAIAEDPEFSTLKRIDVPDAVVKYVVGLMREHRSDFFPLSSRNAAAAIVYMNIVAKHVSKTFSKTLAKMEDASEDELAKQLRSEWDLSSKSDLENRLVTVYQHMNNEKKPGSTPQLVDDPELRAFVEFVCAYGGPQFKAALLANFMVHLDVDTSFANIESIKHQIKAALPPHDEKAKSDKD
jgi:MoxR-like ATPase